MTIYRGYLFPHATFIYAELSKGALPFAVARKLYERGVRTSGKTTRIAQINALNILVRHMMGRKAARDATLTRRIAAKKAQITRLKVKLDSLHAEKRALRAKA